MVYQFLSCLRTPTGEESDIELNNDGEITETPFLLE